MDFKSGYFVLTALLVSLSLAAGAEARPSKAKNKPVVLKFDTQGSRSNLPLRSEEGWPLSLQITVPYQSIDFINGGFPRLDDFPRRPGTGYIFLENPDGCLRLDNGDLIFPGIWPHDIACYEDNPPLDDVYIEYHADVDTVGIEDINYPYGERGRTELRQLLTYSEGSRGPEFLKLGAESVCVPGVNDINCERLGPTVDPTQNSSMGGAVLDGWGLGTDDDLPGLFIYTNKGAGLVWLEPEFTLDPDRGVHNLAGLLSSVSYEVRNIGKAKQARGAEEFNLSVTFNVFKKLFQSILQVDANGRSGIAEGQLWRIDGGSTEELPQAADDPSNPNKNTKYQAAEYLMRQQIFTVKAFMVSGDAPAQLFDLNGDGEYADDAEVEGYRVLSNVAEFSFRQIPELTECVTIQFNSAYSDLDGQDGGDSRTSCPKGPTALRDPPR